MAHFTTLKSKQAEFKIFNIDNFSINLKLTQSFICGTQ